MLKIELSWQAAAVTSACLLGVTAAVRLRGTLAHGDAADRPAAQAPQGARPGGRAWLIRRARLPELVAIAQETGWHAERVARLPDEAAVQRLFLPHPLLVQVSNLYYASLHFAVLIAMLAWLFLRHRDRYPEVRATLVMVTAASLLVQLIPVAPPRMLASDGMIDTGVRYGQSVYGSIAGFNPDELSAMPSVHIAWALLIGITVVRFSGSRWRWLALAYPVATMLVVVVTANHFWADGIVAEVLLVLAMLAYQAGRAARLALERALRGSRPDAAQREPAGACAPAASRAQATAHQQTPGVDAF